MIPKWKIRREARRVKEQFYTFLMKPFYWLQQRSFDRQRSKRIKVLKGDLPLLKDIVILLIYQPQGLPASIIRTLEHVNSQGFSVFVVLNSNVSDIEYEKLISNCALLMKRPNFGYDFGGYRDAILHILITTPSMNSITCINDSIWFPVFRDCDHLNRMLYTEGNLIGYSYSKGVRKNNSHVQSYFFMFKGIDFINSTTFRNYWFNLKISNSRYFTIRNSEMKMTAYFKGNGYQIGWLFSTDSLRKYYETCPSEIVLAAVKYLEAIGHHSASMFIDLPVEEVEAIRQRVIAGLDSGKLSRNVIGSEPRMLFNGIKFAAMKKSNSFNYQMQRNIVVDQSICKKFSSAVAREVQTLNREFTEVVKERET